MIFKSVFSAAILFGGIQLANAANSLSISFTDSLKDCIQFADNMESTFNIHYQGVSEKEHLVFPYGSLPYELVECNYAGLCPDNVKRNTCVWQRYLAVHCFKDSDIDTQPATQSTFIQVQTNSLPNHCYYATNNQPIGDTADFNYYSWTMQYNIPLDEMYSAKFLDSEGNFYNTKLTTQTDVNNQLCEANWGKTSRIDKYINVVEQVGWPASYTSSNLIRMQEPWNFNPSTDPDYPLLKMPNSDSVVGIARNGVFFFSGTSHLGYDVFYPTAYGLEKDPKALDFDICLGNSITYNTYRYHSYSACVYQVDIRKIAQQCNGKTKCNEDKLQWALDNTPKILRDITPIGIAKDGHVIYGPYNSNQQLWQPCDVDVCNGRIFTTDYYGYVATMFHPYIISCWGPGNKIINEEDKIIAAQCSGKARVCYTFASNANYISSFVVYGIAALSMISTLIF
eukprot:403363796